AQARTRRPAPDPYRRGRRPRAARVRGVARERGGVRLALAGRYPSRAGAALQPLRGRAALRRAARRGAAGARVKTDGTTVNIIGAGLAGALLAVLLARRGFAVALYE